MYDVDLIRARLDALADPAYARKQRQHLRPLRGLRGVPFAELARLLVEVWTAEPTALPQHAPALRAIFSTAFEDGLLALGLAAAALPDAPDEALELSRWWGELVDDHASADALGWMLVGPGLMATLGDEAGPRLAGLRGAPAHRRRVAVAAALAALPLPVEGPAAAALRARLGVKDVVFVERPLEAVLDPVLRAFHRDEEAAVRKVVSRALRTWATEDAFAAERFVNSVPGGISKQLREEFDLGFKRGIKRLARAAAEEELAGLDGAEGEE